jgi:hypothetical protein
VISRKIAIQLLAVAAVIIIARLLFDLTSALAYVYPEFDFGQNSVAFVFLIIAIACVLIFAVVRIFQKRFIEGVTLLVICWLPFSFNGVVNGQFWKFKIHKSEYQSIMLTDAALPPRFRIFNWGNRNTHLGGGVLFEAIVYDESDDIARWSPEWIERRPGALPEDRWITERSTSCKRRTGSFGEHFYYVSDEC